MSPLHDLPGAPSRRSKAPFSPRLRKRHGRRGVGDARNLIGRDLAIDAPRSRLPIWLIPGIAVGGVFAALAIAYVRVELIGQGYKRYSVRELRDPARLAALAREMGLSRPDHVITLAPAGDEPRP